MGCVITVWSSVELIYRVEVNRRGTWKGSVEEGNQDVEVKGQKTTWDRSRIREGSPGWGSDVVDSSCPTQRCL